MTVRSRASGGQCYVSTAQDDKCQQLWHVGPGVRATAPAYPVLTSCVGGKPETKTQGMMGSHPRDANRPGPCAVPMGKARAVASRGGHKCPP
jgi:hypothetical protein